MSIRQFKKSDQLHIKSLISSCLFEIFNVQASGLEDLDNIKKNFEIFWVFVDKGKIVGTAGIKNEGGDARISRVYIHPSYRGKGVGKQLMNQALIYCKEHNFKRVFLSTLKKMKAHSFYEKFGFKIFKREKGTGRSWMEKFI